MTFIEEKIKIALDHLRASTVVSDVRIENITMKRCGYKTSNIPPLGDDWEKVGSTVSFDKDCHAWLHMTASVPQCDEKHKTWLRLVTSRDGWDGTNPQCTVFVNGTTACQALDTNHNEMPIESGEKDIYIYFYSGMNGCTCQDFASSIVTKSVEAEKLYYDMFVPFDSLKCMDKNSCFYSQTVNVLDEACNYLDLRCGYDKVFYKSLEDADKVMQEKYYDKLCGKNTVGEISLIGHTHIDVAWQWTIAQSVEKAQRSFSTVIKLMEKYPEYVFMSSQPQLYEFVKDTDPELYEKIKQRIKEKRWEAEGAMWLESDTNLVSGESLIRQILYGKKFMKEEFGVDNHILWLPDVFGYSAALPQILKKCGIDKFFTTKIAWNETDDFPHDNFIWQGIDKTEIFAVLSDAYVKRLNAPMIYDSMKMHKDKKYSDVHISTFGFGDGGGGPTYEMLEQYKRLEKGLPGFPKVTMQSSAETLDIIEKQFNENAENLRFTPKWFGELYLEMHRGTYTTMAENKKGNRQSELLYQCAELFSSISNLLENADYPKEILDKNWHCILTNQFHDIIPGSSIKEVYDVSRKDYENIIRDGKKLCDNALETVAKDIKTDGGYLVVNPSPFERTEIVHGENGDFLAQNIPALGYSVVQPVEAKGFVKADEAHLENDFVKVTFDEKMHIVSFYDKTNDREVIEKSKSANVFEVFEDYPRAYDAWEITEYYKQKKWIADNVTSVEVRNEASYASVIVTRSYNKSTFKQEIRLSYDSARLDFVTDIDWHENHVLLKAAFPLDIYSDVVNCDIQFGHITRPTHRNTSWDEAKFEICAHKWVDMSDGKYGAALLNDCKYGYSAEENVLKLTLLKAPTYPNPVADRGEHHFTYSVYPHKGSLSESDVVKQGYVLNQPLTASKIEANKNGRNPESFGFVSVDNETTVVETVKMAENGNGYVVRAYDSCGCKTKTTFDFCKNVKKAYLCDMLENEISEVQPNGNKVTLDVGNFEVVTVKVLF